MAGVWAGLVNCPRRAEPKAAAVDARPPVRAAGEAASSIIIKNFITETIIVQTIAITAERRGQRYKVTKNNIETIYNQRFLEHSPTK